MFGSQQLLVRFAIATSILLANCSLLNAAGQTSSTAPAANCSAYSAIPVPAEAEKAPVPKAAPNCASYRSYRGIGRPVNYSEARACAWQERLAQKADMVQNSDEPLAWVVGGSLILADIYFNGAGVKSDVPLAMRFACEAEEQMAMLALPEIEKLNGSPRTQRRLEFCDYAATTFSMNFCCGYKSQIEDDRRNRYYNSLKSSMTPEQHAAFEKLLAAENNYIKAHASEVYQGGTIRVMRTIGSQSILKELLRTELVRFERKKWPALSETQITNADALLHKEYRKTLRELRSRPKDDIDDGAVTADQLSSVERTWETYRDAWDTFARLRYPEAASAIRAQITLDRYRLVRTIR